MEDTEIAEAVANALKLLREIGYECSTKVEELVKWFETETPYEGEPGLMEIIRMGPIMVAHELVEIEKVKNMGLELAADTIVNNLERVDDAHLEATAVELRLAAALGERKYILRRLKNIEMWSKDPTVSEQNKGKYRCMHKETLMLLERMA